VPGTALVSAGRADSSLGGSRRQALFSGEAPLHLTNTMDKVVEDIAVRADRIQTELGFQPLVNLQAG
jgi:hypothetical protein